jgi:hypothetical protein
LIPPAKSWLGREDSNLGTVESKSARILNDFNGFSDETADTARDTSIGWKRGQNRPRPEKMSPASTWADSRKVDAILAPNKNIENNPMQSSRWPLAWML